MATDLATRVNYYEHEYLGADDFQAEQAYHRDMRRRHNLAHHTWGIVVGLELVQMPADGDGPKDVFVLPGFAVDGYGREIAVWEPYQVDPELFAGFRGEAVHDVYIEYDESPADPRAGSPGLGEPSQYGRMIEGFRLAVDPRDPDVHAVTVAGGVARVATADAPADEGEITISADESVPYQELPSAAARWPLQLGSLKWDGTQLVKTTDSDLVNGRRHVGLVAESVLVPEALTVAPRDPAPAGGTALVTIEGPLVVDSNLVVTGDATADGDLAVGGAATIATKLSLGADAAAPDSPLEVSGDARAASFTLIDEHGNPRPSGSTDPPLHLSATGSRLSLAGVGAAGARKIALDADRVGVGTTSPSELLHVGAGSDAAAGALVENTSSGGSAAARVTAQQDSTHGLSLSQDVAALGGRPGQTASLSAFSGSAGLALAHMGDGPISLHWGSSWDEKARFTHDGRLGIGSAAPTHPLSVRAQGSTASLVAFEDSGGSVSWQLRGKSGSTSGFAVGEGSSASTRLFVAPGGNVGIGTTSPTQKLEVNGTIKAATVRATDLYGTAHGDLAEQFDGPADLEPGDVVSLAPSGGVERSSRAHDTRVLGVVSTRPGVLLGLGEDDGAVAGHPVALAGRIPCKVSDENGPIERGDLLTSSSTPGCAMRAAGRDARPGTVLGKALEGFAGGRGVIEVQACLG